MHSFFPFPISRRHALAAMVLGLLPRQVLAATKFIGKASNVRGTVVARRTEDTRSLKSGAGVRLKDSVETEVESFARLDLAGKTRVHLGSHTRLLIDRFVAETGGQLELGEGAMLLDRPAKRRKIDLTIRSRFGMIAVRGTRFFAGPSRGVFGVFVARGTVEVEAAGLTRRLTAGQGVDIPAEGQPPGEVKPWGKARIAEALASVGL
jgi:ferric-dicitrate binding protein FerR (iron transport regulator)